MKAYYDTLGREMSTNKTSTKEMNLFINHFLADRDIFESFGFEALYELGYLSASHWQVMQRWSIDRDIDDLEASVLDLDNGQDLGIDVPSDDANLLDEMEASDRPADTLCMGAVRHRELLSRNKYRSDVPCPLFERAWDYQLLPSPNITAGLKTQNDGALMYAVVTNNIEEVRRLVEPGGGYDLSLPNRWARPLAQAASSGNVAIAQLLLQNGARVGGECGSQNPLRMAAANGHLNMVKYLYYQGADVNGCACDPHGNPLDAALEPFNRKIATFLILHGARSSQEIRASQRQSFSLSCLRKGDYCGERRAGTLADILIEDNWRAGYGVLRQAFLAEHSAFLYRCKAASVSRGFKALGHELHNHRKTWKIGMATIRQLLDDTPPQGLGQVLSFLLVVSAMRLFLHDTDDDLGSEEAFCDDLDRWRSILDYEQLPLYDEVTSAIWEYNSHIAGISSNSISGHLIYFQDLIASLIKHAATPTLEEDFLFTRQRLRTMQSKYQRGNHIREDLTQARGAESEGAGISVLPSQEGHRYIEMHCEIPDIAQRSQPASSLVVLLMAGAIFGIVITFFAGKTNLSVEVSRTDGLFSILCFDRRPHIPTRPAYDGLSYWLFRSVRLRERHCQGL